MSTRWRFGLALTTLVALTACGGDDGTGPSGTPAAVQALAGNNQSGTVGQALSGPISVRVTDAGGDGVAGVVVDFLVTSGGGSIQADVSGARLAGAAANSVAPVTTDANGDAEATWTLGTTAGSQTATATVANLATVTFTATAEAGSPASFIAVSGDGQQGPTSAQLSDPLVVNLKDTYGNPVSGFSVGWEVTSGGGDLSEVVSRTDASGDASTLLTPRAPGLLEVSATASALPAITFDARAAGTGSVDVVGAAAAVDNTLGFIGGNEGVGSLLALAPFIDEAVGSASPALIFGSGIEGLKELTSRIRSSLQQPPAPRLAAANGVASIPASLLGTTQIYDPNTASYVNDPSRTDAPANGVRFILYTIDPVSGVPHEPLNEIGHVDIIDTGTPPSVDLSVTAVVGAVTVLDYQVTGTAATTLDLTVAGSVSDGVTQFDFSVDIVIGLTTATVEHSLEIDGFLVTYQLNLTATGPGSIEVTLTDAAGQDVIQFVLNFDGAFNITAGSGIEFNETLVAVFSGSLDSFSLSNVQGDPFTLAELQALADFFVFMDQLTGFFIDLWSFGLIFVG